MTTIPFKTVRERWADDPEYRAVRAEVSSEMDVAFAMSEARHRAKLSQAEVARRIGTSQAMVARWETGKSAPTTTSLRRYAEATGTALHIRLSAEGVHDEA